MTAIALPSSDYFSVITTADRRSRTPWRALLNLPRFGDAHIDYADETEAQRTLWAARLDEAVRRAERPVLLVASGASCFATAWWARLSPASYVSRVSGALLFSPVGRAARSDASEKFASPRISLPFPSAVIARDGEEARLRALVEDWGSGLLVPGGHDRVASGGAWQQAHALLSRATARVVENRMRVADALGVALAE